MKEKKDLSQLVVDLSSVRDDLSKNIVKVRRIVKKDKKLEGSDDFNNIINDGIKILARLFVCYLSLKARHLKMLGKNVSQATAETFEVFLGELKKRRKGVGEKASGVYDRFKKKVKDITKKW